MASCAPRPIRFPLAPPLWVDPDRNHVPARPEETYFGDRADTVDQTAMRPLARAFRVHLPAEATNVNALDEVPDSSWFQNRIGLFAMTPEEVGRGPCREPLPTGPLRITGGKPDGANPGFLVKTERGRFLLKFDGTSQPERATAADVVGSLLYHAAGYHVPCNRILHFTRDQLRLEPGATFTDELGRKHAMTWHDVNQTLAQAARLPDGRLRAAASLILDGEPIGPWSYEGTLRSDPNDVVPHQERRELRGQRLLAAWIAHFDTRPQNSLALWVEEGGRRFVRHHVIDWGDSLGSRWPRDPISRRLGHSHYLDWEHVAVDFLTLGLVRRPWHLARIAPEAPLFGYFGVARFDPPRWKDGYPNPAFERSTRSDALWMARIISRFSEAHVKAVVDAARLSEARHARYLLRVLMGRRERILRAYLARGPALDRFRLRLRRTGGRDALCFDDLALRHRVAPGEPRLYTVQLHGGLDLLRPLGWARLSAPAAPTDRICVALPLGHVRPADLADAGSVDDHPLRYGVLDILVHPDGGFPASAAVRVHLYDLGPGRGFRLAGIERRWNPPPMKQSHVEVVPIRIPGVR